uniref:Helicase POLQ-like n=1 Tax=Syphacia muris TaxID=451379 RepID=A0A0N5AJH2_9BILA
MVDNCKTSTMKSRYMYAAGNQVSNGVDTLSESEQLMKRSPRLMLLNRRQRRASHISNPPSPMLRKHRKSDVQKISLANEQSSSNEFKGSCLSSLSFRTSKKVPDPSEFSFCGLSSEHCRIYLEKRNVTKFYDWQKECLSEARLLSGSNAIIVLPTGSGKTLVAEVLMLREVLVKNRSSLLILPYVAIVQEKIHSMSIFNEKFGIWVEEYAGTKGRLPPVKRQKKKSLYVATIEKANMLINFLIELDRINELGLVIVDELHMIGDGTRGANLEQVLVKYLLKGNGQIIGITATLSNVNEMADFLNGFVFSTDFRPVKLIERVKIEQTLYRVESDGTLTYEADLGKNKLGNKDPDGLVPLLQNLVPKKSVIVFCPTKLACENTCRSLCRISPRSLREHKIGERKALIAALNEEQDGHIIPGLEAGLMMGVAFHHSGLTVEERRTVETAFQDGCVSILCSTSTLAAGVNLPARRVIIKSPFVGREPLKKTQYLQMIGRAGRAGYDSEGDAITIVKPGTEEIKFRELLSSGMERCQSHLGTEEMLSSFLLDVMALKIAGNVYDLQDVVNTTLFGKQNRDAFQLAKNCLIHLCQENLITVNADGCYKTTNLGIATFTASISPYDTKVVNKMLIGNLHKGINFSSHFHLIFIIVPFDIFVDIDWNVFYEEFRTLQKEEQQLLDSFNLGEKCLIRYLVSQPKMKQGDDAVRLYIAFMLQRIWNDEPFWDVSRRFSVSQGWLQSTLQSTCSQAASIARFSEKISSLWPLKHLLPDLVRKLRECKEQELISLMAIEGVKRNRARQLYDKGYRTVGALACATCTNLLSQIENLNRRQALIIIHSAQELVRSEIAEKMEELEMLGASSKEVLDEISNFW